MAFWQSLVAVPSTAGIPPNRQHEIMKGVETSENAKVYDNAGQTPPTTGNQPPPAFLHVKVALQAWVFIILALLLGHWAFKHEGRREE